MKADQKFCLDLDWNLLKIFHSIVEANGVSSAANALWRKQSTISLALQRLERNVGKRLCRRGPAGFALTEEGRILFECINDVYAKVNRIPASLENASQDLRGRLHLRTISNFVSTKFDKLLIAYTARCPLVELHIEVAPWEAISLAVLRSEVDVGIAPVHVQYPELRYELLTRETHLAYCGKRHPLFGSTVDAVSELAQEPLILTGADEPDSLTYYRLRHGLGKRVAATTPNLEEAKRLAILGFGICLLPNRMAAADVKKGLLWPLTSKAHGSACDVYAITNRHAQRRLVVDLFLEQVAGKQAAACQNASHPATPHHGASASPIPPDKAKRDGRHPFAQ
ncbi:MAG: LysR family transcriptional regulator [Hyphomicrobium sp.]|jgi:DNA-binding transcriptional LysR family regulator|uniref:LysR family transcriptional regulator n=1 Tax=Hyphomicrobium sp. TaxID=82 RepID=UPI0025C0B717|nr:LysR family transcriptional regulator [Hyphomicrobium sp.]MBX9861904.1 LysR family transcriptional regulator [Hyphomicrobium sp.]